MLTRADYNPDVLTCLANLSNDEVFTPPQVANQVLDMLPQDIFKDRNCTFLDPATKSGVFLREIAKRLMVGLEDEIPDVQERVNHILTKQLFGLALTELTALLSRRSVYCSKDAAGEYSVCDSFSDEGGNILLEDTQHQWEKGKCRHCGASQLKYNRGGQLETHAYQFIHTENPADLFNMKFDVIISNPPYQLNVGVEKENYAIPIYHKFIEQAKKLSPRFLTMIIPARWYAGGRGLETFRNEMLADTRISSIVDYPNAVDAFPGVDISGGVCYFLWDKSHKGDCKVATIRGTEKSPGLVRPLLEKGNSTFIRFNESISIIRKIKHDKEGSFEDLVSPQTPFGIITSFRDYSERKRKGYVKIYTAQGEKYIDKKHISRNMHWLDEHKVYVAAAYGERGSYPYFFLGKPFLGEPGSCCTQTYLKIGGFPNREECKNVISYMKTRFFRFCIMQKKNTQHAMRDKYGLVPNQDFSKKWTDEKLYKKYKLAKSEIEFIESMVRPMKD